jgi:transcriptional regulator with XRE-family HTH domain
MLHVPYRRTLPVMGDQRDTDREWVKGILSERGWTATELARRAGVNQTTLTRFLHNPDHPYDMSARTRDAIARVVGLVASGPIAAPRPPAAGFYEPDAVDWQPDMAEKDDVFADFLRTAQVSRPHLAPFVLRTHALEALGWRSGDIVLVDLNERAQPGDLVCAQLYDWPRNRADTLFRILQPPFLLAGPANGQMARPLVVDDQNIIVKGVVVSTFRHRAAMH